ncbi:hypothetical protein HYD88_00955 [Mycoplasmopsis bovis]|nr:hypothetical protein [Mycoplasmopsis bovis]QQH36356.1 hypothetical protein HYD88_00955 [Mycoplasmopsis bovis]
MKKTSENQKHSKEYFGKLKEKEPEIWKEKQSKDWNGEIVDTNSFETPSEDKTRKIRKTKKD